MLLQYRPLLFLLVSLATQTSGETMIDIFLEVADTTLPCAAPCVMKNLAEITTTVNKTCLPDFMSAIQRTFTPPQLPPRPTPGPTGAPGSIDMQHIINDNTQRINQHLFNSGFICQDLRKMMTCSTNAARGKCGGGLTSALIQQQNRVMAYYGCSGSGSNKDALIKCAKNPAVTNVTAMCTQEFISGPHAADIQKLSTTPYEQIYKEYLTPVQNTNPPKICQFAETYTNCMYSKIEALKLAECGATTIQQMKVEINALLDLVNCRTYNPRNDALTCLAKPKLILQDIANCFNAKVQNRSPLFLQSFIPGQTPPFSSSFDFSKMCDLVELMDECIESKIKAEPACQGGWTIDMYRSIVTPFRDFIINDHCPTTGIPSNSLGYGTCKNKFRDFPYGQADPNPSSGHLALSSILALTLTSLVSLLVVN